MHIGSVGLVRFGIAYTGVRRFVGNKLSFYVHMLSKVEIPHFKTDRLLVSICPVELRIENGNGIFRMSCAF